MGPEEKKALEIIKKRKEITPGTLNKLLKLNNYAKATRLIDALFVHGYLDQNAFYWEKGPIKYTGKK